MTHQRQPSKTSCGPTCVAILAGVPVSDVLAALPVVRSATRQRKRVHSTNIGEIIRLLKPHGMTLGRRFRHPAPTGTCLLRLAHMKGGNWHWAVLHDGQVYDPMQQWPIDYRAFASTFFPRLISWYQVEKI